VNDERNTVFEYSGYGDIIYELEGSIDNAIKFLQDLKANGYTDLSVDYESGYYSDNRVIRVLKERLETDEEFQKRLEAERIVKLQIEERERQAYETLRAKFEKNK
jgi:hypothetical protein